MNKKALIEKKESILNNLELMLNKAKTEVRNLNVEEDLIFETSIKELDRIEKLLQKNEEFREVKKMDNLEIRDFAEGLLKGEIRANTTTTNSNAIPHSIHEEIVKKLNEVSTVVEQAKIVQANGELGFLVETQDVKAKILNETEELVEDNLANFEKVVLKDKRVGTLVLVSKQLLNNAPNVSLEYITETVSKRIARTLEHEIFTADGTTKRFTSGLVSRAKALTTATTSLSIKDIMNLINDINPIYLDSAKLYMSRAMFKELSELQDNNGNFYVVRDTISDTPQYMILGVGIEITESLTEQIVLANISQAITLKIAENSCITVLLEKYATSGQIGLMCEFYGDSAVTNVDACRVLTKKAARK